VEGDLWALRNSETVACWPSQRRAGTVSRAACSGSLPCDVGFGAIFPCEVV